MSRALALLVSASLLAVGTGACRDGRADTAPTTAAPIQTTTTSVSEPSVVVLEPGTEPRAPLRIGYRPGDRSTIDLTIEQAIDQSTQREGDSRRAQRFDSPPITHRIVSTVTAVDEDGDADFSVDVTRARAQTDGTELDAEAALLLQAELQTLVGVTGQGRISDRGVVEQFALDLPQDLDPDLAARITALDDQIRGLGPGLPADPVGLGARWQITTEPTVAGIRVRTVTTYTLTERTDASISFEAEVAGEAPSQALELPGDQDATLETSGSTGSSTGTQSLTGLAYTVRTEITTAQRIRLEDADGTTTVDQTTETVVAARAAAP